MAVYNGAAYLRQAVNSILGQTYRDFEFLIVNDGSTDDSHAILASYDDPRIRILDNPVNVGLTRSLNRGLAESRGGLIARQDADDISHPHRIRRQTAFLDAHPQVVLVGGQARYIDEQGRARMSRIWWKATTPAGIRFQMLFDSPFFHTAVMFRRHQVWDILGGYDETFQTSQDFELWSRLIAAFEVANLEEILVDQRSHSASVSANYSSANARRVEAVFSNNLKAVLGASHSLGHWPALWISVTNPRIATPFQSSEIFRSMEALYGAFARMGLPKNALAEIRLQYAAKLLVASRLIAHQGRLSSLFNALRAGTICLPLAVRELPRTLGGILLGRFQRSDMPTNG
jgi:glycosyltransferase involved in cell wall biosynthesis